MKYFHWNEQIITDHSLNNVTFMYENGYVFTRIGKGVMHQTRSLRIELSKFELSSENRRILRKIPGLKLNSDNLPLPNYDFSIGKLAKDFYDTKFDQRIMSAQKIKEMLTDKDKSNFNLLLKFSQSPLDDDLSGLQKSHSGNGYAICFLNDNIIHYSYPFYDLTKCSKDFGLAMMILAIEYAQKIKLKYIYLGSLQRPTDVYKLQFSGLEWFDGNSWNNNLKEAKNLINSITEEKQ